MSSRDVSILVASAWILNIQISESPLLILKEALHVIHNEIKREKNSLPSLSPPQALCPSFLARLYGCAEKRQGASKKRAMEKVTANETRAGGKKKNIDRGDKLRIFSTLVILCCSPNPRRRKSGSIIVLMDDWAFTGRPWNLHRGQEGRRLRGIREWFVDVCVCWHWALCDCGLLKHCRVGIAPSSPYFVHMLVCMHVGMCVCARYRVVMIYVEHHITISLERQWILFSHKHTSVYLLQGLSARCSFVFMFCFHIFYDTLTHMEEAFLKEIWTKIQLDTLITDV